MKSLSRRSALKAATAVVGAAVLPIGLSGVAEAAGAAFDPAQRFLRLVGGGNGVIYAVQADGTLLWYRHADWLTGGGTWSNGAGTALPPVAGAPFNEYVNVLASADGQIFGFRADGQVVWYRWQLTNTTTGAGSWAAGSGSVIHSGFGSFARVIGGWNGVIFALDDVGTMFWFRYPAGDGTAGSAAWANGGAGKQIGVGWGSYPQMWADPDGVIYALRQGGELDWWRYLPTDGSSGTGAWQGGGGATYLSSWFSTDVQREWFSNGSGTIYALTLDTADTPGPDTALYWYRLLNSETVATDGAATWANSTNPSPGVLVGSGFTVQREAALQGYADNLSVEPGDTVNIQVSSTLSSYTATLIRLAPAAGQPVVVSGPTTHTGRLQPLPAGYRSNGCGWGTDVAVTIPTNSVSGIYAVRLEGPHGLRHHVVFVVRPSAPTVAIAFVLPTNTYNAYNTWGGHDRYTAGGGTGPRTVTFMRPSNTTDVEPSGAISHTLYSDLYLLRWLSARQIPFDCFHDGDLDASGDAWLGQYKAVVLGSHPEYFTQQMFNTVSTYLGQGGRVINTGGNAMYDCVDYTPDGNAVTYYGPESNRYNLFDDRGSSPTTVIGVDLNGSTYMSFAPYVVRNDHPLLAGTGLSVGDAFGGAAYYGGASGWETDQLPAGGVPGATLIAKGGQAGGADMVFIDRGNGGWVFSASSIAFNSALPYDSAVPVLLGNVFAEAVK